MHSGKVEGKKSREMETGLYKIVFIVKSSFQMEVIGTGLVVDSGQQLHLLNYINPYSIGSYEDAEL